MAPGRIKKFLDPLPFASATHSRRSRMSHSSGAISSVPATTEATVAAAEASDPTGGVTGLVPVVTRASPATELTGEVTGRGDVDTTAETAPAHAAFHMDPKKAREYMENIERFRVLIIGRANAGKTTILQRVCNTVEKPEIFDGNGKKIDSAVVQGNIKRGYHNIEDELVFRSNPGFVFHDSSGFEAGSVKQFDKMKKFVIKHAASRTLKERIHAIWYCIPMTDYQRTVTAAEKKFFNECDTGHVPVVVLLTKVDCLNFVAIEELLDEGVEMEEAERRATERESQLLEKWQAHMKHILDQCKFPPKFYLPLTKMHEESMDCAELIQCTANVLNEEGLERLLMSTQQSSIALCIKFAMEKVVGGMLQKGKSEGQRVNMKGFELDILRWFSKHTYVSNIKKNSAVWFTKWFDHWTGCV
ncbi:hypothetical protein PISMIDRAFT_280507 [Pisolithus microcarpus 441]|uniref:Unplaced genomic scaffold scaffold_186, whole genome shotgun sequence n=1 Tax=Pisolithus microcarpus 441 TaxID=765257 RepID=A0A0C9YQB8_9AGAM|nr:hypothetical protein BKA83DRAFT_280507 [Pisolithus microcarpus]KIK15969.1 hypothetical protein PISMIDRAFT_280507 [Pisolithus microcarpus 441]